MLWFENSDGIPLKMAIDSSPLWLRLVYANLFVMEVWVSVLFKPLMKRLSPSLLGGSCPAGIVSVSES